MTALVPKKHLAFTVLVGGALFLVGLGLFLWVYQTQRTSLMIHGQKFKTEIRDTDAERQLGLSGRESLARTDAMLFVFDGQRQRCFWMKDMKFNIDMVWVDADRKITAIEYNVSPKTYPHNFCHDGQYVIEFAANVAWDSGLKIGDQIQL